jgi:hypothetical protein
MEQRLPSIASALFGPVQRVGPGCPDDELADGHRWSCRYRHDRMAEVMEQLDVARDELSDEDGELTLPIKGPIMPPR